ncbi:unnamed protein product, partial [Tetraodon nigroviridis]
SGGSAAAASLQQVPSCPMLSPLSPDTQMSPPPTLIHPSGWTAAPRELWSPWGSSLIMGDPSGTKYPLGDTPFPRVHVPDTAALNLLGDAAEQGISPATSGEVQQCLPEHETRRDLGTSVKSLGQRLSSRSSSHTFYPTVISHPTPDPCPRHTLCDSMLGCQEHSRHSEIYIAKPRSADHCTLRPLVFHALPWPVFPGGGA